MTNQNNQPEKKVFNLRVEPFLYNLKRLKSKLGFFGYLKALIKTKNFARQVNKNLINRNINPANWDKTKGECVCNIRICKAEMLEPLKEYARVILVQHQFPHLFNDFHKAYYLPLNFPRPFVIDNTFIASSVALLKELNLIDTHLQVTKNLDLNKIQSFMDLGEIDISRIETKYDTMGDMWLKLSLVILKKASQLSIEKHLPIIID